MDIATLSTYKGRHAGEDIYVLASGKSVDHFPPDFFKDRTTIGVNQMPRIMSCTYGVRKEVSRELLEEHASKDWGPLFLSEGGCGGLNDSNRQLVESVVKEKAAAAAGHRGRVVFYAHPKNIIKRPPYALPASDDQLVVTRSTICTALHLAAYMGARAIYLVGHDCGSLDGEANCSGYHTRKTMFSWDRNGNFAKAGLKYQSWLGTIESHTVVVKALVAKKYGCHVVSLSPFVGLAMEGHVLRKAGGV